MSSTYSGRGKVVVYNVITTQQRRGRYLVRGEKVKAHHLADGGGHRYTSTSFPPPTKKKENSRLFLLRKNVFFFFLGDESWLKSRRRRRKRRRWGLLESARDTHSVFPRKTWNSLDEENPERKSETGKSEMQLHSPQMAFEKYSGDSLVGWKKIWEIWVCGGELLEPIFGWVAHQTEEEGEGGRRGECVR